VFAGSIGMLVQFVKVLELGRVLYYHALRMSAIVEESSPSPVVNVWSKLDVELVVEMSTVNGINDINDIKANEPFEW
jgi:hypothetical protein